MVHGDGRSPTFVLVCKQKLTKILRWKSVKTAQFCIKSGVMDSMLVFHPGGQGSNHVYATELYCFSLDLSPFSIKNLMPNHICCWFKTLKPKLWLWIRKNTTHNGKPKTYALGNKQTLSVIVFFLWLNSRFYFAFFVT